MTTGTKNTFSPPPGNWLGSEPEWYIFKALTVLHIDFTYQSSRMGGRLERGGVVLDFLIPGLGIGINVQGTYWHYGDVEKTASDDLQRIALEGQGILIVYIDEEDANRNPIWYTQEALAGKDYSRVGRR